jgi:hypothetical protein
MLQAALSELAVAVFDPQLGVFAGAAVAHLSMMSFSVNVHVSFLSF